MSTRVSLPMALRLFRLMLSPKSGKALRARREDGVEARRAGRIRAAPARAARLRAPRRPMIDVIIPVYKGLQQTRRCIDSVLQSRQAAPFEIVAVDDASPDADITRYLDELAAPGGSRSCATSAISASCSRSTAAWRLHPGPGRGAAQQRHGGGERLARPPAVAARTPIRTSARSRRSPTTRRSARIRSKAGQAACPERSGSPSSIASSRRPTPGRTVDLPTAVGFCMCIRRACLDQIGPFDARALRPRLRRGERFLHARRRRRLAQRARRRRVRLSRRRRELFRRAAGADGERRQDAGGALSRLPAQGARVRAARSGGHAARGRRQRAHRASTPKSFAMCWPSASRSARCSRRGSSKPRSTPTSASR